MPTISIGLDAPGSVLDHLSGSARERFLRIARVETFAAGTTILEEGAATPFLGVVETGRVALRLRLPEQGDRVTILTIEPGEILGWSAVVAPFRATVDAIATEPTTLLAIDAPELRAVLGRDCDLAAELLPLVLESLSRRLAGSWHQLLDLFAIRTPEPW
jgi:CRP/FNR family cyclic AMP-dependent transcriptional regulator